MYMFQASNLSCYDKSQQAQGKLPICQYWHEEDIIEDMLDIDYYNQNYLLSLMNGIDFLLRLYSKSENKETAVLFTFDKVRKLYGLNKLADDGISVIVRSDDIADVELQHNTIIDFTGSVSSLTVSLPSVMAIDYISQLNFSSASTPTEFATVDAIKWTGDDIVSEAFVPQANKRYTVLFYYDGLFVRAVAQGVAL